MKLRNTLLAAAIALLVAVGGSGGNRLEAAATLVLSGGATPIGDVIGEPGTGPVGALAYWGFEDDLFGFTAADTSNHLENYDATLEGGVAFTSSGRVGQGMEFPGGMNSDAFDVAYLDLPDGMDDFTTGITVAGWVKTDSFGNWARVVDFSTGINSSSNILLARIGTGDDLRFENHGGIGPGAAAHDAPDMFKIGEWQHFAATIDNDAAHTARLYVNGVEVSTTSQALPANVFRTNNYIGRSAWGGDVAFDGVMDELYIYDRALGGGEIEAMFGLRTPPDMTTTDVTVTADSTLDLASSGPVAFRNLQLNDGTALATTGTAVSFQSLSIAGGAGRSATIAPENSLDVGSYNDGGVATTLIKAGTATLALDANQLTAAATTFEVAEGTLQSAGRDPLGGATQLLLSGGTFSVGDSQGVPGAGPAGALAYWGFEDNPAISVAADTSGHAENYDGLLTGGVSFTADGKVGQGMSFPGGMNSNDVTAAYLDLPDGMSDFTGGITVAGWVKTDSFTNWARVVDFGNGAAEDNILLSRIGTGNDLRFEVHDGIGPGGGAHDVPGTFKIGEWQHFAATIDEESHTAKIYVDGVEVSSSTQALPANINRFNNYIGRSNWNDAIFDGTMDELYVYDRAISGADIEVMAGVRTSPDMSDVDVTVTGVSTLESTSSMPLELRNVQLEDGAVLTTTGSAMSFQSLSVVGGAGRIATIASENSLDVGTYDDGGVVTTLVKAGSATWQPDSSTLTAAATTFDVAGGTLKVSGDDLLGGSTQLRLSGGTFVFADVLGTPGTGTAPADHVVAHWAFDEAPGGVTPDTTGTYPGTLMEEATITTAPGDVMIGTGALDLGYFAAEDGGYVDLPDGFADFTGGITVSAWALRESRTNWGRVMDFGNGTGGDFGDNILLSQIGATDNLRFEIHGAVPAGANGIMDAAGVLGVNRWQHLVATIDESGIGRLYVDGVQVQSTILGLPDNVVRTNNFIGESAWGADDFFNGLIDDMYVYDRALTAAEVGASYTDQIAAPDLSAVHVAVAAGSATLRSQSSSETSFASLTIEQSTTLDAVGMGPMAFTGGTTIGAGARDVTFNAQVDVNLGALDVTAEPGVKIVKTGPGAMTLSGVTGSVDTLDARTGSLNLGGGEVIVTNLLRSGRVTCTIDAGNFTATGADLVSHPDRLTLNGNVLTLDAGGGAPAGALAYWGFEDDMASLVAADTSGHAENYDAALTGAVAFTPDGKIGQGMMFPGGMNSDAFDAAYLDLPDGMDDFRGGITVALWANPSSLPNWSRFIDFANGPASDNILMSHPGTGNALVWEIYGADPGNQRHDAGGAIDLATWQHFVATIDESNNVVIYKDGVPVLTNTQRLPSLIARTNNFIGRSNWGADAVYDGLMDEIYIYDRALDADQVADLYGGGDGPATTPNPINWPETDLVVTADSTLNSPAPSVELRDLEVQSGVSSLGLQGAGYSFQNVDVADGVTLSGELTVHAVLNVGNSVGTMTINDGELVFDTSDGATPVYNAEVNLGDGVLPIAADKIVVTSSAGIHLDGTLAVQGIGRTESDFFSAGTRLTVVQNSAGGVLTGDDGGDTPFEFPVVDPALAAVGDPAPHIGQGAFLTDVVYDRPNGFVTTAVDLELFVALGGDADGDRKVWLSDWAVLRANFGNTGTGKTWTDGNFDPWLDEKVWLSDWAALRANFGNSDYTAVAAAAVPEPGTIAMLLGALAGLVLLVRRRRAA